MLSLHKLKFTLFTLSKSIVCLNHFECLRNVSLGIEQTNKPKNRRHLILATRKKSAWTFSWHRKRHTRNAKFIVSLYHEERKWEKKLTFIKTTLVRNENWPIVHWTCAHLRLITWSSSVFFFNQVMKASVAFMLGLLSRTAYFLQLSRDNFGDRALWLIINRKQKILNFALPIFLNANQEIKETTPNPSFRGSNFCE